MQFSILYEIRSIPNFFKIFSTHVASPSSSVEISKSTGPSLEGYMGSLPETCDTTKNSFEITKISPKFPAITKVFTPENDFSPLSFAKIYPHKGFYLRNVLLIKYLTLSLMSNIYVLTNSTENMGNTKDIRCPLSFLIKSDY